MGAILHSSPVKVWRLWWHLRSRSTRHALRTSLCQILPSCSTCCSRSRQAVLGFHFPGGNALLYRACVSTCSSSACQLEKLGSALMLLGTKPPFGKPFRTHKGFQGSSQQQVNTFLNSLNMQCLDENVVPRNFSRNCTFR